MAEVTSPHLPPEILQDIATHITCLRDLSALARVNRYYHDILSEALYSRDAKSVVPRALVWAASCGEMGIVEMALEAGSDINATYGYLYSIAGHDMDPETTPLLAAASGGHLEIVRRLVDAGAGGRWFDMKGNNALIRAAVNGHEEVVRLLLEHFSETVYDHGQQLALGIASRNEAIFRLVIEAMDPIMSSSSLEIAARLGYEDIFHRLLERGVEVDVERWEHVGLLAKVCSGASQSHVRIARFLIERGMRVDGSWQQGGNTPLYNACSTNGANVFDMVAMLLEKGANVATRSGGTSRQFPLRVACANGNIDLIQLLLQHSGELTETYNSYDMDAIETAVCESGKIECFDLIVGSFPFPQGSLLRNRGTWLLELACRDPTNAELVKTLIENGANVKHDEGIEQRRYPLVTAWETGGHHIIKVLLEAGANPNASKRQGVPLLCDSDWPHGSDENQVRCLKLLLSFGAEPLLKDQDNNTPLHSACLAGALGCVRLLLEAYDADATAVGFEGMTPLHMAIQSGNPEIIEILIAHGANLFARYETYQARSAMHDACELEQPDVMVEYLLGKAAGVREDPFGCREVYDRTATDVAGTPLCLLVANPALTGPTRALQLLLELNHDSSITDMALSLACDKGDFYTAKILLERGADPNSKWRGTTPLCDASGKSPALVNLLISYGANVNALNMSGHAPIYTAVASYNLHSPSLSCLRILLKAGADIGQSNGPSLPGGDVDEYIHSEDLPPFSRHLATKLFAQQLVGVINPRVLEFLLDEGGLQEEIRSDEWQSMLVNGARRGNTNFVRLLAERRLADIEAPDWDGNTAELVCEGDWSWGEIRDTVRYLIAQKRQRAVAMD